MTKRFYGWWITVACLITFGISTGLPYYNKDFFNDYFKKDHGWTTSEVTLGFPLAALLTLWVGPIIIPRFSPRKLIVVGTGLTCLAFVGFSKMGDNLPWYYFLWFLYTVGYLLSGPIAHQIIMSQWFRKKRGMAMGFLYGGFGVVAALGVKALKTFRVQSPNFDYHQALMMIGLVMFVAWPIALFLLLRRRWTAVDSGNSALTLEIMFSTVRPYFSTAARASAVAAPGITNDPAGNSTPFAVKLFSAIFIATLLSW